MTNDRDARGYSAARPQIAVAGKPLPVDLAAAVTAVRVRRESSAPAVCTVALATDPSNPALQIGATLAVDLAGVALFEGQISAVEWRLGPDRCHAGMITAADASAELALASSVRMFVDMTAVEIVTEIAGDHGLSVSATEDGPTLPRVIHHRESDLAFVDRIADEAGLWWRLDGDTLRLESKTTEDIVAVSWGAELVEAVITRDASADVATVRASGWDCVARRLVSEQARVNAPGAERSIADLAFSAPERALRLARRELEAGEPERLRIQAVLRGDPQLRPGLGLSLTDRPTPTNGPFRLTSVEHVIDASSGYLVVVDSRGLPRPADGPAAGVELLTAVLTSTADPQDEGRVQVRFPGWGDVESDWLPVVLPGTGPDKGLVCLPEPEDTVVVLGSPSDPGLGVVLGGVWPGRIGGDTAPGGVRNGEVRAYTLATRDDQALTLDRDTDAVMLSNSRGSHVRVDQSGIHLHSVGPLTIEAPSSTLTLRAKSVDFERA